MAQKTLGVGGQQIGLRRAQDVQERLAQLQDEAAAPPIPAAEIAALTDLLAIRGKLPEALELLQALTDRLPSIGPAVAHMAARITALDAAGVDVAQIGLRRLMG